jgi:hypothetical protein
VQSEVPANVLDYTQDVARPTQEMAAMEYMKCDAELCLEHLVMVQHGEIFQRRRIGLSHALATGGPLPPEPPKEGEFAKLI